MKSYNYVQLLHASNNVFIYFAEKNSVKNYNEIEVPSGIQDSDMSDSKLFFSSAGNEKSSLDGIKTLFLARF